MKSKVIVDFIKKHWVGYVLGILFMVISSFIQTLVPTILGKIIDFLKSPSIDRDIVLKYTRYMVFAAFGTFITRFVWRYFIMGNARKLECYMRQKLFEHFQNMSVSFYSRNKTGDLMAYAVNDISAVRQAFGPGFALIINGVGIGTISFISMVKSVNFKLTVLALIPIPLIIFLMSRIGKEIQIRFRRVQESFASISDKAQENISGIRVIKSFAQEEDEVLRFEELNANIKKANIDMVRASSILSPMTEVLFGLSFMINLIFGSRMVMRGEITLGDFVAFNGYLTMIMRPVISIGRVINIFQRGMASFKRINELFNVEPEIKDALSAYEPEKIHGDIEIKNLTFTYPGFDEPALKNINLKVESGQILGIVGKTGSGKTTLINLLLKLYNVERNKIYIDGKDINDLSIEILRENIGCVPQDNFLFSTTIEDNIRFFTDEYTDEDVLNAAQMSLIYQAIMDFPEGFSTIVGERGVNLSGGQKQRISIARAIIKTPSILIMDDALSAVDTKTEEGILENLKSVLDGRTGIIIANRISAVRNADLIIVMDKGEIIEKGTHEKLINDDKLYYKLYKEQYEGFEGIGYGA